MTWDVAEWQRRLRAEPAVWAVFDPDGYVVNLDESEMAAQMEVDWYKARKQRSYRVHRLNVHTLDLARERWQRTG